MSQLFGFHSREVQCSCGSDLCKVGAMAAFTKNHFVDFCHLDNCLEVVNHQNIDIHSEDDSVEFRCLKCEAVIDSISPHYENRGEGHV